MRIVQKQPLFQTIRMSDFRRLLLILIHEIVIFDVLALGRNFFGC